MLSIEKKKMFNQIQLDQDSRFVKVFQSDTLIKRFKRLTYGVNSAAAEL